ncbi:MAG: MFS transporter [Candidatus Nanoarchaeia archaeon]|jgi:MFS family permease
MQKKVLGVDRNIFFLGIVSFLTDVSSEMLFSVFSIFFTVILGASTALLGIIEGLADFSASSLDYVSGYLSDKTGKRKVFTAIGYGFSTLAKGILLISSTVASSVVFRVIERLGKSFRGPPRDAWISSLADAKNKGYSFGVHKALDKSGAILGPFIAYGILSAYGQTASSFKIMFLIAVIVAALAFIVLLFIKEKPALPQKRENIFQAYKTLGKGFRHYLYSAGIFSLAYFSFGFLLLKAYMVGFAIKDVVLLYALFNVAFVIVAVPIGKLGDKIGRKRIIASEYILYFLMALGFIFASSKWHVIALFIIFGIFYAIDEGQSKAYITDLETKKRGTAIGVYNFAVGLVYLPASIIAGYLWKLNPNYAFGFAAFIAVVAFVFFISKKKSPLNEVINENL